jgi:hypothetical protein
MWGSLRKIRRAILYWLAFITLQEETLDRLGANTTRALDKLDELEARISKTSDPKRRAILESQAQKIARLMSSGKAPSRREDPARALEDQGHPFVQTDPKTSLPLTSPTNQGPSTTSSGLPSTTSNIETPKKRGPGRPPGSGKLQRQMRANHEMNQPPSKNGRKEDPEAT